MDLSLADISKACNPKGDSFNILAHLTYNNPGTSHMKDSAEHIVAAFKGTKKRSIVRKTPTTLRA
jgi:hypothetical protein